MLPALLLAVLAVAAAPQTEGLQDVWDLYGSINIMQQCLTWQRVVAWHQRLEKTLDLCNRQHASVASDFRPSVVITPLPEAPAVAHSPPEDISLPGTSIDTTTLSEVSVDHSALPEDSGATIRLPDFPNDHTSLIEDSVDIIDSTDASVDHGSPTQASAATSGLSTYSVTRTSMPESSVTTTAIRHAVVKNSAAKPPVTSATTTLSWSMPFPDKPSANQMIANLKLKLSKRVEVFRCVMRGLGVNDANNTVDTESILSEYDALDIAPKLKADLQKGVHQCQHFSKCLPTINADPLSVPMDVIRTKSYLKCEKNMRYLACLKNDMRQTTSRFDLSGLDGGWDFLDSVESRVMAALIANVAVGVDDYGLFQ